MQYYHKKKSNELRSEDLASVSGHTDPTNTWEIAGLKNL